jgi:hypothetical protein
MYPVWSTLDLEGSGSALLMVDALNLDNDPRGSLVNDDKVSWTEDFCVAMNNVEDSAVRGGELGHGTLLSCRLGVISILHIHYRTSGTFRSREIFFSADKFCPLINRLQPHRMKLKDSLSEADHVKIL